MAELISNRKRGRGARSRGQSRGRYRSNNERGRSSNRNRRRNDRTSRRGNRSRGRGRDRARSSMKTNRNKKKEKSSILTADLVKVQQYKASDEETESIKQKYTNLSNTDIQDILLGESTDYNKMIDHIYCIHYNRKQYIDKIEIFLKFKVFSLLSTSNKAKILAALLTTNLKDIVHKLLYNEDNTLNLQRYSVGEMAKVVQLLDAPRLSRQCIKKLQELEKKKQKVSKQKIMKLKTKIYNLQKDGDATHYGSLSGNKQRFFIEWINDIDANILSFFLISFPKTNWRIILDLVHSNPKDFKLSFFQNVIFSNKDDEKFINKESLVFAAKQLNDTNIVESLDKYSYLYECYSYIRKRVHNVPDKAKLMLSEKAPLPDVLWWFDELNNNDMENIICRRLEREKDIFCDEFSNKSAYGKLMERLLKFLQEKKRFAPLLINHIEKRLWGIPRISNIDREHEYRVAIFGDASSSMEVAIKTASILSSLMSYGLSSDLLFFNAQAFDPPFIPRDISEVIDVVNKTVAYGTTCMASALYPYYIDKIKVDLFILVSDEDENRKYKGYYFAELFNLYKAMINEECKLFLVSFVHQGDKGKLYERCMKYDIISRDVKQIRLHPTNPDTSKFDALLGVASLMLLSLKNASQSRIPLILKQILADKYGINDENISDIMYDYIRGSSRESVLKRYSYSCASDDRKSGIQLISKQIIAIPKCKIVAKCEMKRDIDINTFIERVQGIYGEHCNCNVEIMKVLFKEKTQVIEYEIIFNHENEANALYIKNKELQDEIGDALSVAVTHKCSEPQMINNFILQLDSDSSHILCGACLVYGNNDECLKTVHYGDMSYLEGSILHSGDTQVNGKSVHRIELNLSKLITNKEIKQLFFTLCACGPSDLSQFKEPSILLYEESTPDINLIRYEIDEARKSRSVVMCRIFRDRNCNDYWSLQALGYQEWHITNAVCGSYHYAKEVIKKQISLLDDDDDVQMIDID